MKRRERHARVMAWLLLIVTAPGLIVNPAMAGTVYWDGGGADDNWSTGNNWTGSTDNTVPGAGDDVLFYQAAALRLTTGVIDAGFTAAINSLAFGNSQSGAVTIGGTQALTINTGGLTVDNGFGAVTISAPITLGGSQSWSNNSVNTLTIRTGPLSIGANTLTVGGPGNTTISAPITVGSGGSITKTGNGTVTISNATVPSFDTVTLSGGTLKLNTLPTSVPTVASGTRGFWLDASTLSGADNSTVSSWNWVNSSDGTAAMTLVNSPKLRTGANGMGTGQLPVVRFSGGYAYGSFAQTGSQSTVFVVVREPTVNGGSVGLITAAKTGAGLSDYNNNYTYTLSHGSNPTPTTTVHMEYNGNNPAGPYTVINNQPFIMSATANLASGGANYWYVRDGNDTTGDSRTTGSYFHGQNTTLNTDVLGVGTRYVNGNWALGLTGDIGEVLVYTSVLSPADRILIENYLYNKWINGAGGAVNRSGTHVDTTTSSILDLGSEDVDHTLGKFSVAGDQTLTIANAKSVTLAGISGTSIAATGSSGVATISGTATLKPAGDITAPEGASLSITVPVVIDTAGTRNVSGNVTMGAVTVSNGTLAFDAANTAQTLTSATVTGGTVTGFHGGTGATLTLSGSGSSLTTASGAKVATADLSAGTGTVNAANPLATSSTLKVKDGIGNVVTGTYTVGGSATSFSASGSDLANNSVGRTLTLSGGTLKLAGPSGPSAGASNFSAYGTTVNGYEDSFEGSSLGANWNLSSGLSASVSGGKLTLTPTGSWSYTKSSLLYTLGTTTTPQTVLAKVKFNTVGTGDASGRAGVTAATAVDGNGIRFLARNGGSGGNNNLNFLNEAVAWGTVSANNIWSSSKDYWMQLTYDPATGNSTGKLWLADGVATEPTSAVQTTDRYYGTWSSSTLRTGYSGLSIGSGDNMTVDYILIQNSGLPSISNVGVGIVPVNLSNTHIAATASSELDLFASSANHILGDLTLANATLTIKNVNTVEFGNINASGTAALAYDTANGIKLRGTIGTATVTVDSGGTLTLDGAKTTVTAATALAKAGAGTLTMTGTHGYTVATQVNGGTLKLDGAGSINSSSGITVNGSGAKFITTSSAAVTTPITMTQGTIGGTGTISASGGVSIGTNAIQAPGVSPGTQNYSTGLTWAGGGTLQFEINDAGGTAGTDWDLLTGSTLNITATSDSKFTIDITSLSGSSPGNAANFSSSGSYKWKIADFDNAIVVWDAGVFTLLRTHFSNSNTGTWAIKRGDETGVGGDSTELWLTYDPPPPGTYWAPASGGGGDGTWTSSATVWATDAGVQGVGPQATGKLTFGNTVGAVTVNNTVTADAGMDINTTGYTFVAGTGTPKISLTGIDTFANTITVGSSVTATISIALDGTAGMTKAGTGTLVLGATSTYTGATTVNVGTLLVNGMLDTAANAVTVSGTGTLGGTGTIKRSVDVQSGATLAPGTEGTVGELAVTGNVTFQSGSTFKVDGNGATADKLTVTGPVTLNGATLNVSGTPTGTEYEIVLVQGDGNILNGTFSNSTVTWGGKTYKVTYTTTQVKLVLAPGGTVIMFK